MMVFLFQLLEDAVFSVRLAARIVDTPANEMHTDAFIEVRPLLC